MIDLNEARALAEAARADTADGLTAREKLADVVLELCDALDGMHTEWAVRAFDRTTDRPEITPKASEESARRKQRGLLGVEVLRRQVGPWVKVPREAQT